MLNHGITMLALVGLLACGWPPPAYAQSRSKPATADDVSSSLEAAARAASPAVVEIFATSYLAGAGTARGSSDLITTQRASGSGVIVDPEGFIVTNAHVVRGARQLRVELPPIVAGQSILAPPRRRVDAQVVGIDVETDVAVIKVEARNLTALPFGNSDELRAGQLVLAVGSPLGLQNSVSLGVVSNVARQLEPESPMVYVQTDASVNPGSSGGPLLDLRGRIMGINTLIPSQTGSYDGFAFAAPSNIVRTVYEQIKKSGRVRRGDIGVRAQTLTPQLAAGLALPRDTGVLLSDVRPLSTGAKAGLQVGDIVLTLDGKPMENGRQLQVGLYRRFVGDVATLEVLREGKTMKVPVAIDERDDPLTGLTSMVDPRDNVVPRLGIVGVTLDQHVAGMLPSLRSRVGVVVVSTTPGALDSRDGGLARGDVIHAINRRPVMNLSELIAIVNQFKAGDAVVLHLERDGELMFLAFTAE